MIFFKQQNAAFFAPHCIRTLRAQKEPRVCFSFDYVLAMKASYFVVLLVFAPVATTSRRITHNLRTDPPSHRDCDIFYSPKGKADDQDFTEEAVEIEAALN